MTLLETLKLDTNGSSADVKTVKRVKKKELTICIVTEC